MLMTREDHELLCDLIRDNLELPALVIDDTTPLTELDGIDSMKVLRMVASIERAFGIDLGFEAIPQIHTMPDLERLVTEARASKAARVRAFGA